MEPDLGLSQRGAGELWSSADRTVGRTEDRTVDRTVGRTEDRTAAQFTAARPGETFQNKRGRRDDLPWSALGRSDALARLSTWAPLAPTPKNT
uniref:Uncharacterized protein n=1 Tax=Knipowitschia caucasica TaxID=637954 RepID=A0AAV2J776_KNICA